MPPSAWRPDKLIKNMIKVFVVFYIFTPCNKMLRSLHNLQNMCSNLIHLCFLWFDYKVVHYYIVTLRSSAYFFFEDCVDILLS